MARILVTSPLARDGKSVVAAGLAMASRRAGQTVRLERVGNGDGASADGAQFALIQGVRSSGTAVTGTDIATDTDLTVLEADFDAATAGRGAGDSVIVVTRYGEADDDTLRRAIRDLRAAGVVVNATPAGAVAGVASRIERLGGTLFGTLPLDRLLAAPTVRAMSAAVHGDLAGDESLFDEASRDLVVGPVSAHEGMDYFRKYPDKTVVTRHDRTDIQLGALDYEPLCLVVSGGSPTLPYVHQRAESEPFALIITSMGTPEAVNAIGELYGATPFSGRRKLERALELVAEHCRLDSLLVRSPA